MIALLGLALLSTAAHAQDYRPATLSVLTYQMGGKLARSTSSDALWMERAIFVGSMSLNALAHADYDERGAYPADPRMSSAIAAAKTALEPLLKLLPRHPEGLRTAAHLLSLYPDPDRSFLIAALAHLQWKSVTATELAAKLPAAWKPYAAQVLTFREGTTVFLQQSLADQSQAFHENLADGIEYWILLEAVKLWMAPATPDFKKFVRHVIEATSNGTFDDFLVKDDDGHFGLRFQDWTEKMTADVRKTTSAVWNAPNTLYRITTKPSGSTIRFLAPLTLSAGKYHDGIPFQYKKDTPDGLYEKNTLDRPAFELFCDELLDRAAQGAPSAKVAATLTANLGQFSIDPQNQVAWKGVQPAARWQRRFEVGATDCVAVLEAQYQSLVQQLLKEFP